MTGTMQLPERNVSADGSITVDYEDRRHRYTLNGEWVPSATTILGAYDKPALVGAAAKVTLEGVATLHKVAVDCTQFSDSQALADALYKEQLRHWQVWKKTANRGTFVHAVSQAWIEEGRVPTTDDVPADYRPYVQAFGNFVTAHEPESLASEVIVGSLKHGYAGRYDWKARLTKRCDVAGCGCEMVVPPTECAGRDHFGSRRGTIHGDGTPCGWLPTVRIDFKTSKALYPENMAQLDLYEVAAVEMGEDQADYRAPLRLGKDGSYEFQISRLPVGGALGLVAGYKARQNVEELHKHLNPRRKRG